MIFVEKNIQIYVSLEHIDKETFLRSLARQIESIKSLAKDLKYDSSAYRLMLNLHEDVSLEDKIKIDIFTQYEKVSIFEFQGVSKWSKNIEFCLRKLLTKPTKSQNLKTSSKFPLCR